jgi:hypothetical protein
MVAGKSADIYLHCSRITCKTAIYRLFQEQKLGHPGIISNLRTIFFYFYPNNYLTDENYHLGVIALIGPAIC